MFLTSLRTLARVLSGRAPRPRRPARPGCRPRLEGLEDRLAPATVTWTNRAGGSWSTASNWSGGHVPGPADGVVISTLNSGAAVTHSSGTDTVHTLSLSVTLNVTSHSSLTASAGFTLSGQLGTNTSGVFTANGAAGSTVLGSDAVLNAQDGGVIHLPPFTRYAQSGSGHTVSWNAAGGLLDLPNLGSITVVTASNFYVEATMYAGLAGRVNLSGTTSIVYSATAKSTGSITVLASGTNSRIDLPALTSFTASPATDNHAKFDVSNGATINLGTARRP